MVTDFIKERIQEVKFAHTVEKLGTLLKVVFGNTVSLWLLSQRDMAQL